MKHKPDPHPELERFLSTPQKKVSLAEAAFFWTTTRLTFVYERPPDLDTGTRLPSAIRGALGEQLKRVSLERHGASAYSRGTAFDAFYADHCMLEDRWHVPKPFVIWTHADSNFLYVQISLFGEAGKWRDDVAEAMLRIMLPKERGGEGGVTLMQGSSARRIWNVVDVYWRERAGYLPPKLKKAFVLAPLTPIITSNNDAVHNDIAQVFFTIFARIKGLLRWHGLESDTSLSNPRLRDLIEKIRYDMLFETKVSSQIRRSRSYQTKPRYEVGFQSQLKIYEYPEELWPGFVLGTLSHAGYDVPQGYGRYAISDP